MLPAGLKLHGIPNCAVHLLECANRRIKSAPESSLTFWTAARERMNEKSEASLVIAKIRMRFENASHYFRV